ncbi:MAG: hypothetical protein CMC96_06020 [Flavobacteriales bacterium]|nr:hypothetical protein [Flavobacteriales bacterium]|tara:strand:- start:31582 stop:32253 length:672 start_codon:yes stop_codon:yes gene_type:complete
MPKLVSLLIFFSTFGVFAQPASYQIAVLKYNGGGDWYSNLETSLPNLIDFANRELKTNIKKEQAIVEAGSPEIFDYPFVHMTGHGNVVFNNQEAENLRNYLLAGGFLHIDDNYGMDPFIRREIKKLFPNQELIEVPFDHPIYHQKFDFNNGLPKIHEHDKKPPQGFGIFVNNRLVLFYTYESDLGDGWESQEVHNDSESTRRRALEMGANILSFVFLGVDYAQ